MSPRRIQIQRLAVIAALACLGVAAAVYVLLNERAPVPFRDTYKVKVQVSAADGVQPGLGQPVRVAGVKVGTVSDLGLQADNALITLQIDRNQLPQVFADARVSVQPITPLKDMQVTIDPGDATSRPLRDGETIPLSRSRVPVPLSDLLSVLDTDTRDFLTSLLASARAGTDGQGPNLRRVLLTLGPTIQQVRTVSHALASRRKALARLVHNVSLVTRAAADDRQLSQAIATSRTTLGAVAAQDAALKASVARIPGALKTTSAALAETGKFARELEPSLTALMPAVRQLPTALRALKPFAAAGSTQLAKNVRPFVRTAVSAARELKPAVSTLREAAPNLTTSLKGVNYFLNELAYNPPGKKLGYDDEGFLFWAPWFAHNYNSTFSAKDAHGGGARGQVMVSCQQIASLAGFDEVLRLLLPTYSLCPRE